MLESKLFDSITFIVVALAIVHLYFNELPFLERASQNLFITFVPGALAFIWCMGRAPYVHIYRIDKEGLESANWQWEPRWASAALKALATLYFTLATLITIRTNSGLVFTGALLFAGIAGISIFCRPPPRVYRGRPRWENYDMIIVDRSRRSIFLRSIMNPVSALQIHPPKKEIMSVAKLIHEQIPGIELKEGKWKGIY